MRVGVGGKSIILIFLFKKYFNFWPGNGCVGFPFLFLPNDDFTPSLFRIYIIYPGPFKRNIECIIYIKISNFVFNVQNNNNNNTLMELKRFTCKK